MVTQPAICPFCAAPTFGMRFCTNCGAALHITTSHPGNLCPRCGTPSLGMQFCTNCGTRLTITPSSQMPSAMPPETESQKKGPKLGPKYGALRTVAAMYRVLGWVLLIGGSALSAAAATFATLGAHNLLGEDIPQITPTGFGGVAAGVGGMLVSVLMGLSALAFADICYLLIDIRTNAAKETQAL